MSDEFTELEKEFLLTFNAAIKRNLDKLREVNDKLCRSKVDEKFTVTREAGKSKCELSVEPITSSGVWVILKYALETSKRFDGRLEPITEIVKARALAEIFPLIEEMIDEVRAKMQEKLDSLVQFYREFTEKHITERIVEEL